MARDVLRPWDARNGGAAAGERERIDRDHLVRLRDEAAARAEEARSRRDELAWREYEQLRRNLNYLIARRECMELTGRALIEGLRMSERHELSERVLHAVRNGLYRQARFIPRRLQRFEQ